MKINPDIKGVWVLGGITQTIIYSAIYFIIEILFLKNTDFYKMNWGIVSGIIFLIGIACSLILPNLYYKVFEFEVKEDELLITKGVFVKVTSLVPFSRIQHLDVEQSIYERMFHLSRLVIHTAGSKKSELYIPGLPLDYSEDLRDHLRTYIKEDVV